FSRDWSSDVRSSGLHAPPDPGLVARGGTAYVEGDHTLVRVPDVDHTVGVGVRGLHLYRRQQRGPVVPQPLETLGNRVRLQPTVDDRTDQCLVQGLGAGRIELRVPRVLPVSEQE